MAKRLLEQHPPSAAEQKKLRRSRRLHNQPACHILSLSDDELRIIFNHLSLRHGYVNRRQDRKLDPAFNLAATCRRLDTFYRCSFAHGLDFTGRRNVTSEHLFSAMQRNPNITQLVFDRCWWSKKSGGLAKTLFGGKRGERPFQTHAPFIKSLRLSQAKVSEKELCTIARRFTRLERIACVCNLEFGDAAMRIISDNLSDTLRSLDLSDCRSVTSGPRLRNKTLTDVGGALLGNLRRLKHLCLGSCQTLTDVSFSSIGMLQELQCLALNDSKITDSAACTILPRLVNLKQLNMSDCPFISGAILPLLPRSLDVLYLANSGALLGEVPPSDFEHLSELSVFWGSMCPRVKDLSFLAPMAARLVDVNMPNSGLSDRGAAQFVSQMKGIQQLCLSASEVGDETARAISNLDKLTVLDLSLTKLTHVGLRFLAVGAICGSLTVFNISGCPATDNRYGDVEVLRFAMGNARRIGHFAGQF